MPRVDPSPAPPLALTDPQVAAAMAKALELRRRVAINPSTVRAQAMDTDRAVQASENWHLHTRWFRWRRGDHSNHPVWYWIGWIEHTTATWGIVSETGEDRFRRVWEVWLNVEDGRVWLRWERYGRCADDPYP